MADRLRRDRRGAALLEFALVLPLLVVLVLGLLGWGQYFLLAHSVQQLANDAARATVAGLSPVERGQLARASVARALPNLPDLPAARVTTGVSETADLVTVRVAIDASHVALFRNSFVPLPDPTITRSANVRPGGFE